jgi:hypothetical protein
MTIGTAIDTKGKCGAVAWQSAEDGLPWRRPSRRWCRDASCAEWGPDGEREVADLGANASA